MEKRVTVFTACNGKYLEYIPLFALSHLFFNPDAFVEVVYEGYLPKEVQQQALLIHSVYPESLIVRPGIVGRIMRDDKYIRCAPHVNRFIIEPWLKSDYAYITDVDIFCMESIVDKHLEIMAETGLPYSNIQRIGKIPVALTGLHFSKWDAYYPVPDYLNLIEKKLHNLDEAFLAQLVMNRHRLPSPLERRRPVHGIHASPNREPQGFPGWSVERWAEEWKSFRESEKFGLIEPMNSERINGVIAKIDSIVYGS